MGAAELIGPRPTVTGAGARHEHDQPTPAATWTITHGLGADPIVEVIVDDRKVLTDVEYAPGVVAVIWPAPTAGRAVLIA